MKMNRVKTLLMVAMIAVLLTATIGGTLAWLATSTDPVENTFTPAKVDTEIEEDFTDETKTVKSSIVIKNTVSAENGGIPVYVRVAIVGNWVKNNQIVGSAPVSFTIDTDWIYNESDGYYYYTKAVPAGESTDDLLGSDITSTTRTDGAHLEVTVIHQSIQTEPAQALTDANWGWTPSTN